eukprot:COSAG01_NODE_11953_length_1828_cov_2.528051_2_plen_61_part_00
MPAMSLAFCTPNTSEAEWTARDKTHRGGVRDAHVSLRLESGEELRNSIVTVHYVTPILDR